MFGRRMRWNKGVDALQGQGIIYELGACRTGFYIVDFAVTKGATDGSEADNVVRGRVHVGDHPRKEEEVAGYVLIVVCTDMLGVVTLYRVVVCPEGWDVEGSEE